MQSSSYQEKFKKALSLFQKGLQPVDIVKLIPMDLQTLRNNLRTYGYIDNNKDRNIKENIFNKIDSEEKAYWLGFLYADGYVSSKNNRIGLVLKDKEHIQKFKEFLNIEKPIKNKQVKINGKIKQYYNLTFRNQQIHKDLIKLGCIPNKSLKLVFPKESQLSKEFINPFVRGYFDGDGCIHHYSYEHGVIISLMGTKSFLEEIKHIYNFPNNKYIHESNAYEYKIGSKKYVSKFLHAIYDNANIFLERKYECFVNAVLNSNI